MLRSAAAMTQNYKETLNLPRTDFPMKANLAAREPELPKMWEETRLYGQIQKSRDDPPFFVLHGDPAFTNGDLHMRTALTAGTATTFPSNTKS
jgi:isoleucyl-tRNA synthetase